MINKTILPKLNLQLPQLVTPKSHPYKWGNICCGYGDEYAPMQGIYDVDEIVINIDEGDWIDMIQYEMSILINMVHL